MPELDYYYEDMPVGTVIDIGSHKVTAEEIIEFAEQFDPAPFHLDEEAGKASFLGGLAASGWHVCSIAMKMICDSYLLRSSSEGSPGVRQTKWLAPVLAGDTLKGKIVVETARLSASRPGLGIIELRIEIYKQDGTKAAELHNLGMMRTRSKDVAS